MSKTNWDLKSGDIVAMNDLPDAALYVVTQVEGVEVGVQQLIPRMRFPQDRVATEWADISSCRTPSIKKAIRGAARVISLTILKRASW